MRRRLRQQEHPVGPQRRLHASPKAVTLVFHQHFARLADPVAEERQAKGWRAIKEAGVDPR